MKQEILKEVMEIGNNCISEHKEASRIIGSIGECMPFCSGGIIRDIELVLHEARNKYFEEIDDALKRRFPNIKTPFHEFIDILYNKQYGKLKPYFENIINNSKNLSLNNLIDRTFELIKHNLNLINKQNNNLKEDKLRRDNMTLILFKWSGQIGDGGEFDKSLSYFKKLVNVILNESEPTTAREYIGLNINDFQYGLFIKFKKKQDLDKVIGFLIKTWKEWTKDPTIERFLSCV